VAAGSFIEAIRRWSCLPVLSLGITLAACSTTPRDATAWLPDKGTPEAQVYIDRCAICHALPHPRRHSYQDWQNLLPVMEQRMAERGVTPLSDGDRQAILAYLKVNGR
jgi:hypothetical protein